MKTIKYILISKYYIMTTQYNDVKIYYKYDSSGDMDSIINSDGFTKVKHFDLGEFMTRISDDFCRNADSIGITYFRIIMRNILFYAELNGELIGIISVSAYKNDDGNIIKINGLCSPNKYKDYKIGAMLINNVIFLAKQSNIKYIILDCTPELFSYYNKFGFDISYPDYDYFPKHTYEMKLVLPPTAMGIKRRKNKKTNKYKKRINRKSNKIKKY